MEDDSKPLRLRKDGQPDQRGHSSGSQRTQFTANDKRRRPGRPKGSRDDKTDVEFVRDMPVEVMIGNRSYKVTTRTAIYLKMRDKALKGDLRAAQYLERKFAQYEPPRIERDLTRDLLAEDQAILRLAFERGMPSNDPAPEGDRMTIVNPAPAPGDKSEAGQ